MAGEFDVLAVRLEAHIATFQAQLDRARADLSRFATSGAAPAAVAMNNITTASTRATPSLNRLNNAFISLGRQITGVPPVVGQFTGVLGPLAIGAGPLALALAGLTALAGGFMLITKEAREAKKAAEEAIDASNKRWRDIQTQGDADLIDEQNILRVRLVEQAEKVERAKAAHENKEYLAKLNTELLRLQGAYLQTTTVLTDRRNERAQQQAERTARAEEKAANDAATAWQRAYAQMEEAARERVGFTPDLNLTDPLAMKGFAIILPAAKDADDALAQLKTTVEKLNKELGLVPVGSTTTPTGTGLTGRITEMLNPETIASGLALGLISNVVGQALPKLGELAKQILGLGGVAEKVAAATQRAINDLRDSITLISGSDLEKNFVRLRQDIQQRATEQLGVVSAGLSGRDRARLNQVFSPGALQNAGSFDELVNNIRQWQSMFQAGSVQWEYFNDLIEYAGVVWEDFNNQIRGITDGLRNVPSGFKIALAQFNATAVSPTASPLLNRYGLDVTVHFNPSGVFETVETQAVMKIRSGGRPAWERA